MHGTAVGTLHESKRPVQIQQFANCPRIHRPTQVGKCPLSYGGVHIR
jgi:hypothetical protein